MSLTGDLGFLSVPKIAGSFSGRLIICGSGRCLWDDLHACTFTPTPTIDTMAIKQAGMHLPFRPTHWAGAHGERFQFMVPLRYEGYYFRGMDNGQRQVHTQKLGVIIHSDKQWPLVDHVWSVPRLIGTSALFGVRVAIALGYEDILLCGVPLDNTGRYYDAPWNKGVDLNMAGMGEWEEFLPVLKGRVRSMSGRTRDLLGGP